jgi:four helix bundle protein
MGGTVGHYRDLLAWQHAMDLVESVYRLTRRWPREELHGLTNQVRRAVISVPANIAEGQGRSGIREYLHHLSIAHGSLREVETYLHIAMRLDYCDTSSFEAIMAEATEVGRLMRGLMRSLRT